MAMIMKVIEMVMVMVVMMDREGGESEIGGGGGEFNLRLFVGWWGCRRT